VTSPGAAGKRRLGRGLEALLGPQTVAEARAEGTLVELPVASVRPNPYQPRHAFNDEALEELAVSMRAQGLLQPITVRITEGGDAHELIAGERRWRAAQRLEWEKIPAVIRAVDDRTLLTLALIENLQRDALSPIDEARGYQRLIDEFGASQSTVADLVARHRTTVTNALRLLKLPQPIQDLVHTGRLTTGHARALLGLGDRSRMERVAQQIVERELSVREVEDLVRGTAKTLKGRGARSQKPRNPDVRRVEESLRQRLKTDVRVTTRGKSSGRVTIHFYSDEDLARVLEIVLGEPYTG
jgi:ParB family chromosome partitioning protein